MIGNGSGRSPLISMYLAAADITIRCAFLSTNEQPIQEPIMKIPSTNLPQEGCGYGSSRGPPRKGREPEVLVHRFPANAVIAGEDGFRDTVSGALDQFGCPFRGVRVFFRPLQRRVAWPGRCLRAAAPG